MKNVLLNDFKKYLIEKKAVSDNTLESYSRDVTRYLEYLSKNSVKPSEADTNIISGFVDELKILNKSTSTITRTVASIRSFYQYLILRGMVDNNPAKNIKLEKTEKKLPEILNDKEIRLLLSMPNSEEPKGARDKAMLEVLYATGIRVSELINLNVNDVKCSKNERGEIICRGGKVIRTVPMHPAAVSAMSYYINNIRPMLLNENSDDALFINLNGQRLTRQGFWKIVKNYAEEAKIDKEITPHTLRHSFAMHLYQNGASLHDLQIMLGHADISSTQLYANIVKKNSFADVYDRCHPFANRAQ